MTASAAGGPRLPAYYVHFGTDADLAGFKRRLGAFTAKGMKVASMEKYNRQHFDPSRDQKWAHLWQGMPEYVHVPGHAPHKSFKFTLADEQSAALFRQVLNQPTWDCTSGYVRGYWYPPRAPRQLHHKHWATRVCMPPRYPVYIVSKGRWERPFTARLLDAMGVAYRIAVEPQERDLYAQVIDPKKILVLPFQDLGQGSIPARNWVWDHALKEKHRRHWVLDDNITTFFRRNRNEKRKCLSGNMFRAVEDWVDRYRNVAMAGLNYQQFVVDQVQHPPVILNTRIYSCILIDNSLKHRWRGKYNEDTDLSLRVLKDGMCTALFNVFMIMKVPTMTMKGGNTDDVYQGGKKRREFAESLRRQHPDVVKVTRRYQRWHHVVDYAPFRHNQLQPGKRWPTGVNQYGMVLADSKKSSPTA